MDPAFASNQSNTRLCNNVFENLVGLDESLYIQLELADSIQILNNGTEYWFQLNQHKAFSNGKRITSDDVIYSFERLLSDETASPGSWVLSPYLANQWYKKHSDSTFSLYLHQSFSPFIQLLSLPYCGIIQQFSDTLNIPVGSGPYVLENTLTDEFLRFTQNSYYQWHAFPKAPNEVVISSISDGATELLSFLDNKTHLILDLDNSIAPLILDNGAISNQFKEQMKLTTSPFLNVEYLGFNLQSENCPQILQNQDFRKALAMAIPKKQFVSTVLGEKGEPASGGMIPNSFKEFQTSSYGIPYHQSKAKQIIDSLAKIGIKQQHSIQLSVAPTFSIWAETIQGFWKAIGVESIIDVQSNSMVRSKMRSGELHCFRASWIADYPSPENYASLFYSKNSAPPNYTRYKNVEVDKLYEQGLIEKNASKTWRTLDSIVIQSAQVIPIVYDEAWWFCSPKITGAQPDAMNRIFFHKLEI